MHERTDCTAQMRQFIDPLLALPLASLHPSLSGPGSTAASKTGLGGLRVGGGETHELDESVHVAKTNGRQAR